MWPTPDAAVPTQFLFVTSHQWMVTIAIMMIPSPKNKNKKMELKILQERRDVPLHKLNNIFIIFAFGGEAGA